MKTRHTEFFHRHAKDKAITTWPARTCLSRAWR